MKIGNLKIRKCDNHGCGHFGASRGSRIHRGVDLLMEEGLQLESPVSGVVTKLGYPYADPAKDHIRYVEVTSSGYRYRMFYVQPVVEVGDEVVVGDILGVAQDLTRMYEGIGNHIHLEIKNGDGDYIDPTPTVVALQYRDTIATA